MTANFTRLMNGRTASLILGALLTAASGCTAAPTPATQADAPSTRSATSQPSGPSAGQRAFTTPDEAVKAVTDAAKASDRPGMQQIFGPVTAELISDDKVQAEHTFKVFSQAVTEMTNPVKEDDAKYVIYIGKENWPFPIPLVRDSGGKWFFDTAAGKDEILNRRIGKNELKTIAVMHGYVMAQREYAQEDRTGNEVPKYAQRLESTPGQKDGLYWPTAEGEAESPLAPLVEKARGQGYPQLDGVLGDAKDDKTPDPYHGYYFKIITKQGAHAAGGKYDYVINGNMIGGFALVAFPSNWGTSGVMTFIVNQRGKVYQKDLGEQTAKMVAEMTEYDPDDTWTLVKE